MTTEQNRTKNYHTPPKPDYNKMMEEIIAGLGAENVLPAGKPKLLLHACCAPCSSNVLERLCENFDITIFYYNPNIHPQSEYERRLEELRVFLQKFEKAVENKVKLIECPYDVEDYFTATKVRTETELQKEPERGERCRRCYDFRMKKSWAYALENNFDFFTTTLTISPHKDSIKINELGFGYEQRLAEENIITNLKFLPSDFKKKNGYLRSLELSSEYGLYRQDYCGCVYSKQNI